MDSDSRQGDGILLTVGHSNHPIDRFIGLIRAAGIELIVDVRSVPFSRFAPQFNRRALERSLGEAGIGYLYRGDVLGGRPAGREAQGPHTLAEASESPSFREGLRELRELSLAKRCAVMCAERDPDRCHRTHLIAAGIAPLGVPVAHLLADGTLIPDVPDTGAPE